MPRFQRIDHVVIASEDTAETARLWERNLGLKAESPYKPASAGFQVARLPVGDAFLELVQPLSEGGGLAEELRKGGEGLFSLSIEVDDLEAAVAYLRERGASVSDPESGIWPDTRVARIGPTAVSADRGSSSSISLWPMVSRAAFTPCSSTVACLCRGRPRTSR